MSVSKNSFPASLLFKAVPVVLLLLLVFPCPAQRKKKPTGKPAPVAIIFDTDFGPDYDDAGAMGMLHAFADKGEARILATVASNLHPLVAPGIEVMNTYFGRADLPVGAPKTAGVNMGSSQRWLDTLAARYPHRLQKTSDAPDAVAVYRRILASQPDKSVTIVSVGFLTNLRNLLESGPDSFSPMNGRDLVKKKVKQWVAMAGIFPDGKEFNIEKDAASSQIAIDGWPTPVLFSGFEIGKEVKTGLRLIREGHPDSPVREVFAISIPKSKDDANGRMSWDQTALLVAVRGTSPYYDTQKGRFITKSDGTNGWQEDPAGPHTRLIRKMPPERVAQEIETLMMHQPVRRK